MNVFDPPDGDPFRRRAAFDSLAKQLADDDRRQLRLAEELRGANFLQKVIADTQASLRLRQAIIPESFTRLIAQRQKALRDAAGPLESLRASSMFKSVRDDALERSSFKSVLDEHAKSLAAANDSVQRSMRQALESIGPVTTNAFASLNSKLLADLSAAARPFASIQALLDRQSSGMRSVMDEAAKRLDWSKSIRWPVIDDSAAAAVARIWGEEGLRRQARSLGLDRATIDALVQRAVEEASEDDGDPAVEAGGGGPSGSKQPSIMEWLSILGVLLAILVPIWQKMDSDATEARLVSEIKAADERNARRVEALAKLLEKLVERSRKSAGRTFVAKSRVALIRRVGESGSAVQAEVFPNQVVKLVSENGKWIQVEHFDWLSQEERVGWALKKYFVRVPSTEP